MFRVQNPYSQHAAFVAPAWNRTELWRIFVMMIVFEVAFVMAPAIVAGFMMNEAAQIAYYDGVTALASIAQFATFGVTAWIFVFVLRRVHDRGFWSLIGVGGVLLSLEILYGFSGAPDIQMQSFPRWIFLMPIMLVTLLIQVGTEEIFFRGYLQQQLRCFSAHTLVWMAIPSLIFGLAHYPNGDGVADGVIWAIWAAALGLACADLTARSGTLGAAIGLHLANNIIAIAIINFEGSPTSGLALFLYPAFDRSELDLSAEALFTIGAAAELLVLLMHVLVMWLAARVAIRR